jgi:two-component system chemotaxis response regulator CheB
MTTPLTPKVGDEPAPKSPGKRAEAARPSPIRVMIVDDSLTVRTIFRRMVESDRSMEVAATASSGERAIAQLRTTPVDVVLLDLEMPGMGGLKALPVLLESAPETQVLVVSSLTMDGAEATVEALSQGAADTLLKPRPGGFTDEYRTQLLGKIRALGGSEAIDETEAADAGGSPELDGHAINPNHERRAKRPEVVAIGASTGGIHALNLMLREIGPQFDLPILVTQHLPASFIPVFARQIEVASGRPARIAEEGTEIRRGEIAVATGHGHMAVRRVADRLVVRTLTDPAPSGCLPSVDPMFASLASTCEGRVLAIMLSGMGRDGFEGAEAVVAAGGTVWAQNAETSAVWGMPGAVARAGLATYVAAPEALGRAVMTQLADANAGCAMGHASA